MRGPLLAAAAVGVIVIASAAVIAEQQRPSIATNPQPEATATSTLLPSAAPSLSPRPSESPSPNAAPTPDLAHLRYAIVEPTDAQRLIDIAAARGEYRLPLPDVSARLGLSLQVVHSVPAAEQFARLRMTLPPGFRDSPSTARFALVGAVPGRYDLPALTNGTVIQVNVGKDSTFNHIAVNTPGGGGWALTVPSPAASSLRVDDVVRIGQTVLSFTYAPESQGTKTFQFYLTDQHYDAPANTLALISYPGNLSATNLLTTRDGSVVTIAPAR